MPTFVQVLNLNKLHNWDMAKKLLLLICISAMLFFVAYHSQSAQQKTAAKQYSANK